MIELSNLMEFLINLRIVIFSHLAIHKSFYLIILPRYFRYFTVYTLVIQLLPTPTDLEMQHFYIDGMRITTDCLTLTQNQRTV